MMKNRHHSDTFSAIQQVFQAKIIGGV